MWSRFGPDRQRFYFLAKQGNAHQNLTKRARFIAEEERTTVKRMDAFQKWKVEERRHSLIEQRIERVEIAESQFFVCPPNRLLLLENFYQTINFLAPFSLRFFRCALPDPWAFSLGLSLGFQRSAPFPNFWRIGIAIMFRAWVHPYSRDFVRPGVIAHLSLGIPCQISQILRCKESFQT